jgi:hypothetical protein
VLHVLDLAKSNNHEAPAQPGTDVLDKRPTPRNLMTMMRGGEAGLVVRADEMTSHCDINDERRSPH